MDYWLSGEKERVHFIGQPHEQEWSASGLRSREYEAGEFGLGLLGRRGKEKALRLAEACAVDPQGLLAFLQEANQVAKLDKARAKEGLHPALDAAYADVLSKPTWQFNGRWLHWHTDDVQALILLSLRAGLAVGTVMLCRECGSLTNREPKQGRHALCSACGSQKAIKERRLQDPLKKAWDRAYQRYWQRLQAQAITNEEWEEWKRVAKNNWDLVRIGVWSLEEWQAQCVDNWPPHGPSGDKETGGT